MKDKLKITAEIINSRARPQSHDKQCGDAAQTRRSAQSQSIETTHHISPVGDIIVETKLRWVGLSVSIITYRQVGV